MSGSGHADYRCAVCVRENGERTNGMLFLSKFTLYRHQWLYSMVLYIHRQSFKAILSAVVFNVSFGTRLAYCTPRERHRAACSVHTHTLTALLTITHTE